MSQFIQIPTIGLVLVQIVGQDVLANIPLANGRNGYFFATDTGVLYYDSGSWVAVGGSGSGGFVLLQVLTPGTAQTGNVNLTGTLIAGIVGIGTAPVISTALTVKDFTNGAQIALLGDPTGVNNGPKVLFNQNGGVIWTVGEGFGATSDNFAIHDSTNNVTPLDIAPSTGNTVLIGTVTAPRFIGPATALQSATTSVDVSAAAAPVAGQALFGASGTAATWQTPPLAQTNFSTSDQTVNSASAVLLTGSLIAVPVTKLRIGTIFRWTVSISKTAAGTDAMLFAIRVGTNGTVADTSRVAFTFTGSPSATADAATVTITAICRGPLSASGIFNGNLAGVHEVTGGLWSGVQLSLNTTSAAFNVTTANLFVSLSLLSGVGTTITVQQVITEAFNL